MNVYRFRHPKGKEANERYRIIENRGERVLCEEIAVCKDLSIKPTCNLLLSDLVQIDITKLVDIEPLANKKIKYLSKQYLALHVNIRRFAEPHVLAIGHYAYTEHDGEKLTKILITR